MATFTYVYHLRMDGYNHSTAGTKFVDGEAISWTTGATGSGTLIKVDYRILAWPTYQQDMIITVTSGSVPVNNSVITSDTTSASCVVNTTSSSPFPFAPITTWRMVTGTIASSDITTDLNTGSVKTALTNIGGSENAGVAYEDVTGERNTYYMRANLLIGDGTTTTTWDIEDENVILHCEYFQIFNATVTLGIETSGAITEGSNLTVLSHSSITADSLRWIMWKDAVLRGYGSSIRTNASIYCGDMYDEIVFRYCVVSIQAAISHGWSGTAPYPKVHMTDCNYIGFGSAAFNTRNPDLDYDFTGTKLNCTTAIWPDSTVQEFVALDFSELSDAHILASAETTQVSLKDCVFSDANKNIEWIYADTADSAEVVFTYDVTIADSSATPIAGARILLTDGESEDRFNGTTNISGNPTHDGTHTGSSGASVLTDSTAAWTTDELIGLKVYNTTDGSSGVITDNTATTVTAALGGGTDDDWDASDVYSIPLETFRHATWTGPNPAVTTTTTTGVQTLRSSHTRRIRAYGYLYFADNQVADGIYVAEARLLDNLSTVLTKTNAGNLTGIAINGATKVLTVESSGTGGTASELYDYGQWWGTEAGNIQYDEPLKTGNGISFSQESGWTLVLDRDLSGAFTFEGDLELSAVFDIADIAMPTGTLDITTAGTYSFTDCSINEITNSSGGAVTIQTYNSTITTNTGPNVTIENPVTVTITVLDSAGAPVVGAMVFVEADAAPLGSGVDIIKKVTNGSGVAEEIIDDLTANQTYAVRIRKGSAATYYKPLDGTGTITIAGNAYAITYQLTADE